MKLCRKCSSNKEETEFYKNRATCKACLNAQRVILYADESKKEQQKAYRREYYKKNKDRITEYNKSESRQAQNKLYRRRPEVKQKKNQQAKKYNMNPERKLYGKNRHLIKTYGITLEEYNNLYSSQAGLCAICGDPGLVIGSNKDKSKVLAVDHNHNTGVVRELLCYGCNLALGAAKESKSTLLAMIAYLEKHN